MIKSIFVIGSVVTLNLLSGLSAFVYDTSGQYIIVGGGWERNKLINEISDMKNAYETSKIFSALIHRRLANQKSEIDAVKNSINDLKNSFEEQRKMNESKYKELVLFDQRYDPLPQKCAKFSLPIDCDAATMCTQRSGIYQIKIVNENFGSDPLFVDCDAKTENGTWLVIQRRQDGSVDFYRNWTDYENGFGDLEGEFFIGLKKLNYLTNNIGTQELLIIMEDDKKKIAFAKYDTFSIGNANEYYALKKIGKYSGNAGDALQYHIGMKFSTKDRDNDIALKTNCAQLYTGAWWYKTCHGSNLNGKYNDNAFGKGINWVFFNGFRNSLKYVKMMIRRRRI